MEKSWCCGWSASDTTRCLPLVSPSGRFPLFLSAVCVSWVLPGLRQVELLGSTPHLFFLSCPKKSVLVMAPLPGGESAREKTSRKLPDPGSSSASPDLLTCGASWSVNKEIIKRHIPVHTRAHTQNVFDSPLPWILISH